MQTHVNWLLTFLWMVLALRVGLPTELYNLFVPYTDVGGSPLVKIHPATLLLLGLAPWFLLPKPSSFAGRHETSRLPLPRWMIQFAALVASIAFINTLRFGTGGMAYMLDTLLAPAIFGLLMSCLEPSQRLKIGQAVILFLLANSALALIEFALKWHLLPFKLEYAHFRATAWMGNPLNNALITAALAPLTMLMPWSSARKYAALGLMFVAVLAYGGRSAFVLGGLILIFSAMLEGARAAKQGQLNLGKITGAYMVLMGGLMGALALVFFTPFGQRFLELGVGDEGAKVRLTSFELLGMLSPSQLWGGIDFSTYQLLLEINPQLTIIENFWINMLVSFGIILFAVFVASFVYYLYKMGRNQSWYIKGSMLSFILVASTNNSLSTKTLALLLFVVAVYAFRKEDA